MLDFNNPQSENIFTASRYIDQLKSNCYRYVLRDFIERQILFKEMISISEELSEFSETAFPESTEKISQLCDEVTEEIGKLQSLNEQAEPGKCKVCNGELSLFQTHYEGNVANVPLCADCGRSLILKISQLERPTGVWAI
jgi:DNA repair exonuclease SbcCD ATPase subunit